LRKWMAVSFCQKSRPPRSLYGALSNSRDLRLWLERSVWGRTGDAEEHLANITRRTIQYFLERRLAESGKRIVGDKTPFLPGPGVIKEIHSIYPEAKVIHMIRDGRDAEVSWTHHRWNMSKDQGGIQVLSPGESERREAYLRDPRKAIETGIIDPEVLRNRAAMWKESVGRAMKDGPELLGANYTEVKYECLLEDTASELERLLEFLSAKVGRSVVEKCVRKADFESLSKGRQKGEEDPTSLLRKGIAGDWRNVFTEKDKAIFKEEAGDLLIELGYERDGNW
jgi:hypothetical protein